MSKLINQERAELLLYIASKVYGVNALNKISERPNVWCRMSVSVVLRNEGNTFEAIGQFLNKNHATIIHGVKKHLDYIVFDKEYQVFFKSFEKAYKNPEYSSPHIFKNIKNRIAEIISTLKELGYDEQSINDFFVECAEENKLKIA